MHSNGERGAAAQAAPDFPLHRVLRWLLRRLLVWWLVGLIRALELLDGEDGSDADLARMLLVDALMVLADPWGEHDGG